MTYKILAGVSEFDKRTMSSANESEFVDVSP